MSDKLQVLEKISSLLSNKRTETFEIISKCDKNGILEYNLDINYEFSENATFYVSLLSLETDSLIPNIDEHNNKLYYSEKNSNEVKTISLHTGSYDVSDISKYIAKILGKVIHGKLESPIEFILEESTGLCQIKLEDGYKLYFKDKLDTFRNLLGIDNVDIDKSCMTKNMLNLLTTRKIYLTCDLCRGSNYKGRPSNIIYSISNTKRYGSIISIKPQPLQRQLLMNKSFNRIVFIFKNENNNPVDFQGADVAITLQVEQQ